ncbi:MAG: hypothetical protein WD894_26230 [Pirellulales bacterium]
MAIGHATFAGQDKPAPAKTSTQKAAESPKQKGADEPKEVSVVDYESKSHGALQVKSASKKPGNWFDVLQGGKRAFKGSEPLLDSTLDLPPGAYVVVVNRTERKVNVEAGKKTILLTGDLVVESKRKGTFWVPKQGKETRLASTPPIVNRRVALFPGKYNAYINVGPGTDLKNLGAVEVKAGKTTVVKE